jgi:hypothetical protein
MALPILSGQDVSALRLGAQYKNRAYSWNGRNKMSKFDGVTFQNAGISRAIFTPTVAVGVAGAMTGRYRYYVVPVNTKHTDPFGMPVAGIPSAISLEVNVTSQKVDISGIPATHADSQVDYWYIYRNKDGVYDSNFSDETLDYFYVGQVAIGTTTYTDNATDSSLNSQDPIRFNRNIPPTFKYGALYGERLFGCGFDPYMTGGAVSTGATVNFTGASIPDGVVGCWFKAENQDRLYRITARGSSSQVTLDATPATAVNGPYRIFRYEWEIYFSEFMDPEAWGPDGEAFRWRKELPGYDKAVGLMPFNGQLLVFSYERIYAIVGKGPDSDSVALLPEPLFNGYGSISGLAICRVENEVYFLDRRGPAMISGNGGPQLIGQPLNTDWLEGLTAAEQAICCCYSNGDFVWYCYPVSGETENSLCFRYHRRTGQWWPENRIHPKFGIQTKDSDSRPVTVYAQGKTAVEPDSGTTDNVDSALSGTVTTGGTTTLTNSGATFPTNYGGLAEAYVHVFRTVNGLETYVGSRRIISNTATQLTWSSTASGGGTLTVAVGDTYEIGNIWWTWKTANMEVPAHEKKVKAAHATFGSWSAGATTPSLSIADYIDGNVIKDSTNTYPIKQAIPASEQCKKFDLNVGGRDYAALLESRNGATVRQVVLEVEVEAGVN